MTLAEVLQIARDLRRAQDTIRADRDARKRDICGAWSDNTWTDRVRVLTLGPLSLGEHALNRAACGTTIALLKPALALGLSSLKSTPEAAPYGHDLAGRVVDALIRNLQPQSGGTEHAFLCNMHRDYCGMGLFCDRSGVALSFTYAQCFDGWPIKPVVSFSTREDLKDWLADQSDLSLSGVVGAAPLLDWENMGNQRLSRARFVAYVNEN